MESNEAFDFNISKSELKQKYEVTAIFYNNDDCLCRKNCIIKRKGSNVEPELLIIMMNPGSCKPSEEYYENERCNCIMDDTQKQIAILMEFIGLKAVQIENLSDICEGNSDKFWKKYKSMSELVSIFNETRINEIEKLNVPIIYAWGASAMNLAKELEVETIMKGKNTFGFVNEGKKYYQRPLALCMKNEDKIRWIKAVGNFVKKNKLFF